MVRCFLCLAMAALAWLPYASCAESMPSTMLTESQEDFQDMITWQDGLAVCGTNGIYTWNPDSNEIVLLAAYPETDAERTYADSLFVMQDRLYWFDHATGTIFVLDADELILVGQIPPEAFWYEDWEQLLPKEIRGLTASDDRLYLLLNSFTFAQGDTNELLVLDDDFQMLQCVDAQNITRLYGLDDQRLLVEMTSGDSEERIVDFCDATGMERLHCFDLTELVQGTGYVWDAAQGVLYYTAAGGKVCVTDGKDTPRVCAYLPFRLQLTTDKALLWQGYYVYLQGGAIVLRQADPEGVGKQTVISILGMPDEQILLQFAAYHGDIALSLNQRMESFQSLQQAIVSRNDDIDLYIVSSDDLFWEVRSKGYAESLDSSSVLAQQAERLYPWIREALYHQNELIAWPLSADIEYWTINRSRWQELNLGDYPTTYEALFQLAEKWENELAEEHPDLCLFECPEGLSSMVRMIVRQYLLEHESGNEPVSFDTEEFRVVMEAAWANRAVLSPCEGKNPLIMTYPQYLGTGYNDADLVESYLPPKLTASSPRIARGTLELFILNPASKHKEEALMLLEYYAQHLDMTVQYRMDAICQEPVRPNGYEARQKTLLEEIEQLRQQLLISEDAQQSSALEETIQTKQLAYEKGCASDWLISAEDIAIYHEIAQYVTVPLQTIYPSDSSSQAQTLNELIEQYVAGRLNLDQLIQQLDEKAQMMYYEENGEETTFRH